MKIRKAVIAVAGAAMLSGGIGASAFAINNVGTNNNHPDCDDTRVTTGGGDLFGGHQKISVKCQAKQSSHTKA